MNIIIIIAGGRDLLKILRGGTLARQVTGREKKLTSPPLGTGRWNLLL